MKKYNLFNCILSSAVSKNEVLKNDDERLTVGQRRLISFARVLVREPVIYLFDEVTANLDSYTETLVLEIMQQIAQSHLCIMISHKESDLKIAKEVITIN